MKITTTISGQDSRRLTEAIERRIRERLAAQSPTTRTRRDDTDASPPPRSPRRDRRS